MKVKYQFIEEHELLIHKFIGEFILKEYENYIDIATQQHIDTSKVKKMFTDLRDLGDTPMPEDIPHFISELIRIREKVKMKSQKNVFLVNTPLAAAITSLYQDKQLSRGFDYSVCTTLKFAIKYLGLPYSEEEMEKIIKNLKYEI